FQPKGGRDSDGGDRDDRRGGMLRHATGWPLSEHGSRRRLGEFQGRSAAFGAWHVSRLRPLSVLTALVAAALAESCAGIPQDDRYQTHDGGRSNSRAEAPSAMQQPSRE